MKYPRNVTNDEAVRMMLRLEKLEEIDNGDAWFTIDSYYVPILQGFIEKDGETFDILYRFEADHDPATEPDALPFWKKKKSEEVNL